MPPQLNVNIAGIKLKNPVLAASGTFGYGEEYSRWLDLNQLGGIVVKGLSLNPHQGNPPPRIVETPAGMLNAIGLENVGLKVFLEEKLPFLTRFDTAVIINIWGKEVADYVTIAKELDSVREIAGLELNVSCPNIKKGGISFGTNPDLLMELVQAVRSQLTRLPLIVKLSPNVTDIVAIAIAAEKSGADALSLINTLIGMAIDVKTRRPRLANITGGLSGPAIHPIAVRMVWQVAQAVKLPIIGLGGIMNSSDALEFIIAGARAVAVGTANFITPQTSIEILNGLRQYLVEQKIEDVNELVGSLAV
ncbi:MAG: dihydroorotate dehydrogenase [Candidatus Schekmanbacteria bacterium]|nr:dihydroorotate dehydrogenase [Candidatus Schekmanbacteria bacterium]